MPKQLPHIFLIHNGEGIPYVTPKKINKSSKIPPRDRQAHSTKLASQMAAIWAKARDQDNLRSAASLPVKEGIYIEFIGATGYDLVTKSLENVKDDIRLLNVHIEPDPKDKTRKITRATVFVPQGKHDFFLKKINEYAHSNTKKARPRYDELVRSIEDIKIAIFESIWCDDLDLIPKRTIAAWCEIWLRGSDPETIAKFRQTAAVIGLVVKERVLFFPDRMVLLAKGTKAQLYELIETCADLAEMRRAKESARFFLELANKEQTEWMSELRSRMRISPDEKLAVCILDTGANNGHDLLQPILADSDCQTVEPDWGTSDHEGHGTLMCGVAAFGDLVQVLQHNRLIYLEHRLESVKILPPRGANDPDLYGDITVQAMSRAAIQAPHRIRIGCMAVTSKDGRDQGRPSSWSAALDQLTSGAEENSKLLIFLSAGNLEANEWQEYPNSNLEHSVHDPGQSWNAITVGAYTDKAVITSPEYDGYSALASPGQLSPFSSTSTHWEKKWPIKPEILMEGGNLAKKSGYIDSCDDFSMLSTHYQPTRYQFREIKATSAAAAQAAWMAAQIQAKYPKAWPETIRGLMIHAADWPRSLKYQFLGHESGFGYTKGDYSRLLRIAGYGIPNLGKALSSASNSLTLVVESEIQPFSKQVGRSDYGTKDMILHRFPWPREILLDLGERPVEFRVTLSYFIEPAPGEVGWRDKYRYASFGLRFALNNLGETEVEFLKRLNKAAREEGEKSETKSGSERWLIGSTSRDTGSIHSDIWKGTAAELASCNLLGVYPVYGWWGKRAWLGRGTKRARYALIASLHTPDESIDIYTPVAISLGVPVEVNT